RARGADLGRDRLAERLEALWRQAARVELDVARFLAEVEGGGAQAEAVLGHRREQVLAGVLLHVIEAPLPVELDPRRAALDRALAGRCGGRGGRGGHCGEPPDESNPDPRALTMLRPPGRQLALRSSMTTCQPHGRSAGTRWSARSIATGISQTRAMLRLT